MKAWRVAIHTGPLSADNFAHLVECLRDAGGQNFLCGTERLYFEVAGTTRQGYGLGEDRQIVDAVDAGIAARNLLKKAFGAACGFQPIVSNCL